MPKGDSGLVHFPTEVDFAAITETWEVDETHLEVLNLDAEVVNLTHLFADCSGQFGDAHLVGLKSRAVAIEESEGSKSTEFGELAVELAFFRLERRQESTEPWNELPSLLHREIPCEIPPLGTIHDYLP